jgi:hypothetical protein
MSTITNHTRIRSSQFLVTFSEGFRALEESRSSQESASFGSGVQMIDTLEMTVTLWSTLNGGNVTRGGVAVVLSYSLQAGIRCPPIISD